MNALAPTHIVIEPGPISIGVIVEIVAGELGVPVRYIMSDIRDEQTAQARQIVCWLARRYTALSTSQIGRAMGRDHTTVLYSVDAIEARLGAGGATVDGRPLAGLLDGLGRAIEITRRALAHFGGAPADIDVLAVAQRVAVDDGTRGAISLSVAEIRALARRVVIAETEAADAELTAQRQAQRIRELLGNPTPAAQRVSLPREVAKAIARLVDAERDLARAEHTSLENAARAARDRAARALLTTHDQHIKETPHG